MTQFNFIGEPHPSLVEQQKAIEHFNSALGPFKEEFEQSGGVVTFNYSFPDTDNRRISFNLDNDHDLVSFFIRWQEYSRSNK